ncbi:hypothetical protein ACEPAF_9003 [Sanghuangporus sanghuang]
MTGRSYHHRHHGQPEHPRSAAPQTDKQEGSRDKNKRPKLVKAKDARAQVDRHVTSLRKKHIDPLYGKTVIYQSELAFINRIGESLPYVEEAWKAKDAADERAEKAKEELRELWKETVGREAEDRKETQQKSDLDLARLEAKYRSELRKNEECGEYSVTCSNAFITEYCKARNAYIRGFESITSSKRDEENQFFSFCENIGKYITKTSAKKLQDVQLTLGIVNKARAALGELSAMCDAQAIQAVMKDLEENQAIWRDSLSGNEAGYVEKSVLEEAKKKLDDLKNSTKKIEAQREMKQKSSDAKERLDAAMTDMDRLRHPSQKGSKKR